MRGSGNELLASLFTEETQAVRCRIFFCGKRTLSEESMMVCVA